mgnify:CR=1 FL=1
MTDTRVIVLVGSLRADSLNRRIAETLRVPMVHAAIQEDADAVGLSVLSGAHLTLFPKVVQLLAERDASDIVVFGGGIIPDEDIAVLEAAGVAKVFTPGASTHDIVAWVTSTLR